ncbi:hypothetical protein BD310DRAFT_864437 [Dichomitus squalens]|uniref:Uncharacterized protein n=1 Tax=Dichomitus squalens TaxID=114155 RepID=A0A4Q9QE18_9APHY|nr:hypothetical protein BD310DRAFT_864437 [Dichomitus squalens]
MPTDRVRSFQIDLKPRRHHGYAVLLFILGTLLPPLAVAARFGIGTDFWLNLVLTICGYIPGHAHNFYIQNIRNNKTHRRTPKWAQKWGLIDTSEIKRKERRSQWANRYNERLPHSALENQPYAEGEVGGSSIDLSEENNAPRARGPNGEFWDPNEERYYGQNGDAASTATQGSGRWRYPANFDDAVPPTKKAAKKGKKDKKDRWARTEDAYAAQEEGSGRRKKSKKRRSPAADAETYSQRSESTTEFPEDPEGGLYGDRRPPAEERDGLRRTTSEEIFNHEL